MVIVTPSANCYITSNVSDSINCTLNECVCLIFNGLVIEVIVILVLFNSDDCIDNVFLRYIVTLCANILVASITQSDMANTVPFIIQVLVVDICIYYGNIIIIIIFVFNIFVFVIVNVYDTVSYVIYDVEYIFIDYIC